MDSSRRDFLGTVVLGNVATGLAGVRPSSAERVRVGLIGAGDRGVELLHQLKTIPGVDVAALSDICQPRLDTAAKFSQGARKFQDYRRVLDDASVDAVMIATPTHLHAEQFCAALDAGKHVYVEKTLALTAGPLEAMRRAHAGDEGRHVVAVGHQACSSGQRADAAEWLSDPQNVGAVGVLNMRHHRNTPAGKNLWARPALLRAAASESKQVDWTAFDAARSFDAERLIHWRYFWDYSSGPLSELFSQQLAFWCSVLNLEIPLSATAVGAVLHSADGRETPDTLTVTLAQPERLLINWSCGLANNHPGVGEELLGSYGTISRGAQIRYAPQKLTRPDAGEQVGRAVQNPSAHVANFFAAIREGTPLSCSFETGYRVSVACIMAAESYHRQRTVGWNAETHDII